MPGYEGDDGNRCLQLLVLAVVLMLPRLLPLVLLIDLGDAVFSCCQKQPDLRCMVSRSIACDYLRKKIQVGTRELAVRLFGCEKHYSESEWRIVFNPSGRVEANFRTSNSTNNILLGQIAMR